MPTVRRLFIRANAADISACTDLSDGGLAVAAFEMADHAQIGVSLETVTVTALFGEDQARYLIACTSTQAAKIFAEADADHSGELDFEVKRAYVVKCSKDFNCPSIAV